MAKGSTLLVLMLCQYWFALNVIIVVDFVAISRVALLLPLLTFAFFFSVLHYPDYLCVIKNIVVSSQ